MKLETTLMVTICGLLTLPACRSDEGTQVPETRTPYMDEERTLEDEDEMRQEGMEEGMREEDMREEGMREEGMREPPEGHGAGEMGTEPM